MTTSQETVGCDVLFCARCTVELQPGRTHFYQVTIEAVADPSPPATTGLESTVDLRRQIEATLAQLAQVSAQEALDQVYRRLVLQLCVPCFRRWIENPTG